jgi:hypothetical protein
MRSSSSTAGLAGDTHRELQQRTYLAERRTKLDLFYNPGFPLAHFVEISIDPM